MLSVRLITRALLEKHFWCALNTNAKRIFARSFEPVLAESKPRFCEILEQCGVLYTAQHSV